VREPIRAALAAALVISAAGCAPSSVYLSKNYSRAGKVALLPLANNTNDLDGPPFIRKLLMEGLNARGFRVLAPDTVDAQLKAQGFTDGGQLRAATPQQLAQWTGADLLFYPVLDRFDYINVGYYWQRRVTVSGRLLSAQSGEKLWAAERSHSTRWLVTDKQEAEQQFAVQTAAKALEKMTHAPLQAESRIAVNELLNTLPAR